METLDIVTCWFNPVGWSKGAARTRAAILHWLDEPNVRVTLVECALSSRKHELADIASHPRVTYVPVRCTNAAWCKESLLNIGFARAPADAQFFGAFDADVHYRSPGWAREIIAALHLHPVVQCWETAFDMGPNDNLLQTHTSFASLLFAGKPVVSDGGKFWKFDGGSYDYAHTGYAWAWTRRALAQIGGLFDLAGMGSADYHIAAALIGKVDKTVHANASPVYLSALKTWESRALAAINQNIGFVARVIEHKFHGSKVLRNYTGRWGMFVKHAFDPHADLQRSLDGVIEWAGNKPELQREFHRYLISRQEDANTV